MRDAMRNAAVGDDVYGEDPTVSELEQRTAALLEKESALFVPSGTMSNQIALLVHTRPGDEVVIGEGAHVAFYESGRSAALAGVQFAQAGVGRPVRRAASSAPAVKPKADYHPRTSLVCLENTHNRAGGRVFPLADAEAVVRSCARARARRAPRRRQVVERGARHRAARGAAGAPVRHRERVLFEGLGRARGLRAGRLTRRHHRGSALPKNVGRRYAPGRHSGGGRAICDRAAARSPRARSRRGERTRTRAVSAHRSTGSRRRRTSCVFRCRGADASRIVLAAKARSVLINATGPDALRAVLHLDVSPEQARRAAERLCDAIQSLGEQAQ